eukprot:m.1606957 g.1606957  ORF g.1606957 m.1606957 type:complete len:672 (+) comp25361_c0_seq28:3645-5660(+)
MMIFSLLLGSMLVAVASPTILTSETKISACNTKIQQCHPAAGSMPPDNYTAASPEACCTICNTVANCVGFIYQDESRGCHLKSSMSDLVVCSSSDSAAPDCKPCGVVRTPPPTPGPKPAPKGAKNVLFVVSDDYRPSTNKYGVTASVTPNLDKLAETGILFRHAYIQFSYCAPSRNSFMSGRRPDATKVYNFNNHFREQDVGSEWASLPEHFKQNGYLVTGAGKLFHPGVPPNFDQPRSWSAQGPDGSPWPYEDQPSGDFRPNASTKCDTSGIDFNDQHFCLTTPSEASRESGNATYLLDEAVTNLVISRLTTAIDNWKKTGQPFFVGLGTHRPHLPWVYPRHFFDATGEDVAEAKHKEWPANVPHLGFHDCAEMSHPYYDTNGQGTPFSDNDFSGHQALMRRAYYGCLSYADNLIGQALAVLESTGADAHTVVSFVGDHGWHLGEHNMWCKMSTLELGTRIPFLLRAPWIPSAVGVTTSALAEAVDLYPTLSELAGLELPTGPAGEYLGGTSLVPVMQNPDGPGVKSVALSQFPRCWQNNTHHTGSKPGDENNRTASWENMADCHWTDREYIDYMGYRMRTGNMSITQWSPWNGTTLEAIWDKPVGIELYLHVGDDGMAPAAFDDFENINLAGQPEYAAVQASLLAQLKVEVAKWRTPWPVTSTATTTEQ